MMAIDSSRQQFEQQRQHIQKEQDQTQSKSENQVVNKRRQYCFYPIVFIFLILTIILSYYKRQLRIQENNSLDEEKFIKTTSVFEEDTNNNSNINQNKVEFLQAPKQKNLNIVQELQKELTLFEKQEDTQQSLYLKLLDNFLSANRYPEVNTFYQQIKQKNSKKNVGVPSNNIQISVCAIVPTYLNLPNFMIKHSLDSIFIQKYINYKAVIFSHPSQIANIFIKKYLRQNKIPKEKYSFVKTNGTNTLENIYNGVHNYCQIDSIVFIIEGGNVLIGNKVFYTFNFHYSNTVRGIVFSNHFKINATTNFFSFGGTNLPNEDQIRNRNFKDYVFYQGLTFRSQVFKEINIEDLKDDKGIFFEAYIFPIMIPLLQLSCRARIRTAGLYLIEHVDEDYWSRVKKEKQVFQILKTKQNYECSKWLKLAQDKIIHNHTELDYVSQYRQQKGGLMKVTNVKGIDQSITNKDGKNIADILYDSKIQKKERQYFSKQRISLINKKASQFPGIQLTNFNLKMNNSLDKVENEKEIAEYLRLSQKYHFDYYQYELPICIIVTSQNNNAFMRIQYNLNSVFRQNYSNYFAVIINDLSTDGSDLTYRKYFDFYNLSKDKYVYIDNQDHKTVLENHYNAIHNTCSNDSIFVILDGGDQFISRNVLKLLNANYQRLKGGFFYANFYSYNFNEKIVKKQQREDYTLQQKKNLSFRNNRLKFGHILSFNTSLFKTIDKSNFLDSRGKFYKSATYVAEAFPAMENACGRIYYIPQFIYFYNNITKTKDNALISLSKDFQQITKKKEECDPYFSNLNFSTIDL